MKVSKALFMAALLAAVLICSPAVAFDGALTAHATGTTHSVGTSPCRSPTHVMKRSDPSSGNATYHPTHSASSVCTTAKRVRGRLYSGRLSTSRSMVEERTRARGMGGEERGGGD